MGTDGLVLEIFLHDGLIGRLAHETGFNQLRAKLLKYRRQGSEVSSNSFAHDFIRVSEVLSPPFEREPRSTVLAVDECDQPCLATVRQPSPRFDV